MTFYKGGKFIVVHTVNNSDNCPTIYRDTIIIPPPPKVVTATKDTFGCLYSTMQLVAKVFNAKTPYRYYWTRPITHISGDTFQTLIIPNINRDSTMRVQVTDADGCKFYDTAVIFLKPLPTKPNIADQRICTYETATFDALHADTMRYLWNTGDTVRQITQHIAGLYSVIITDKVYRCQIKDTLQLFVNDTVTALAGKDVGICTGNSYAIVANHRNSSLTATYLWTDLTLGVGKGPNTSYTVSPKNTGPKGGAPQFYPYELYAKITQSGHTCEHRDTMVIRVNPSPVVGWSSANLTPQCHKYGDIKLDKEIVKPASSLWNTNNIRVVGSSKKYGPTGLVDSLDYNFHLFRTTWINNAVDLQNGKNVTETITVIFTDTNGCVDSAKTKQRINGNPVIVLDTQTYCQDLGSASLAKSVVKPKVSFGTQQAWFPVSVPSGVNASTVVVDNSAPAGTAWVLNFGTPTEDFYAGTYRLRFTVTDQLTGCFSEDTTSVEIVTEPKVTATQPPSVCENWDTVNLTDYIQLNGARPVVKGLTDTMNYFRIVSVNADYNEARVGTKLVNGYMFLPSWKAGDYLIKFSSKSTGCLKEDSFLLTVNPVPSTTVTPAKTLCEGTVLDLSTMVITRNPAGGVETWVGQWVSGGFFTANSNSSTSTIEGPYKLRFDYKIASTGCTDTQYINVRVRNQPELLINTTKPASGCQGKDFMLKSTRKYADNGVQWLPINGSTGTFPNGSNADSTSYRHSAADQTAQFAWVKVSTLPIANEVCPQASDSIQILLYPYPVVDFTGPVSACAPLTADFTGIESSGIPPAQLKWRWDFGNGDTSDQQNPTGVLYKNQGKYPVSLIVTNTLGPCATPKTVADYVLAYPKPVASFTTDPTYKTTIALPKFRTFNNSTLDKSVFGSGYLQYHWDFGDPFLDPNDTSTQVAPRWSYGKDTNTYLITLIAKSDFGCLDTTTQFVHVGPDIIVFIPDIFTPNGVGISGNNVFKISALNYKTANIRIYNRWGAKMWETDDINIGWDGKTSNQDCQQGVYVYRVELTSFEDKLFKFDGTITLLR